MAKTLLDIVQDILPLLDSDEINSISDTYEALQIARIVKQEYENIVEEYGLATHGKLSALEAVSDINRPTHLKLPSNVRNVVWWKYDKRLDIASPSLYNDVKYLDPKAFVEQCNSRDSTDTDNQVVSLDANTKITISKVSSPTYWTTFDNTYIVCDSFDSNVDSTLQESKTQAFVEEIPAFLMDDSFVPELPDQLFALLCRSAEATAYALQKQAVNPKLEQKEKRMRVRAQRNKYRVEEQQTPFKGTPNYGR